MATSIENDNREKDQTRGAVLKRRPSLENAEAKLETNTMLFANPKLGADFHCRCGAAANAIGFVHLYAKRLTTSLQLRLLLES
jgi:hypothetical protein